jgi:hypothetical protein
MRKIIYKWQLLWSELQKQNLKELTHNSINCWNPLKKIVIMLHYKPKLLKKRVSNWRTTNKKILLIPHISMIVYGKHQSLLKKTLELVKWTKDGWLIHKFNGSLRLFAVWSVNTHKRNKKDKKYYKKNQRKRWKIKTKDHKPLLWKLNSSKNKKRVNKTNLSLFVRRGITPFPKMKVKTCGKALSVWF